MAEGRGCTPNSTVQLSVDGNAIGTTMAQNDGSFSAPLTETALGHHTVTAVCGPTLQAILDVVLTSHAGPPTTTAAILLIILLLVLMVTRWELFNR